MHLGLVGLGGTTRGLAGQLIQSGHEVVVYDRDPQKIAQLVEQGARGAFYLAGLVEKLPAPRTVMVNLPAGNVMDDYIELLAGLLSPDDVIIDASDSQYRETARRADMVRGRFIHYLDVGIIKNVCGLEQAYCFSVGGRQKIFNRLSELLQSVSLRNCSMHSGPVGAGHLVKTIWKRMHTEPSRRKCSIPFSIKGYTCDQGVECPELKRLEKVNNFVECRPPRDVDAPLPHILPRDLPARASSPQKTDDRSRDTAIPLLG